MSQKRSRVIAIGLPLILLMLVGNYFVYRWQSGGDVEQLPTLDEMRRMQEEDGARRKQEQVARLAAAEERREQERQALLAEEDAFLASVYGPERRRWTVVPRWVREVYVDPSGDAWFRREGGGGDNGAGLKASVEEAVRRGRRIVRGGDIVLIDRRGGVWVRGPNGSIIGYVDGV